MTTILVFGDSIAWGAWDTEGGWVARLRREIDRRNLSEENFYCPVYNLGVSSDTSSDLLARFDAETNARLKEGHETILIIAIGDNDAAYIPNGQVNQTPSILFRKNISALIKKAKKLTPRLLLLSPLRVDETKTNPVPWNTNISYRNEDMKAYGNIVQEETQKENVAFLDVQSRFDENTMLSEDGLHPNNKGHEYIFQKVKKALEKRTV